MNKKLKAELIDLVQWVSSSNPPSKQQLQEELTILAKQVSGKNTKYTRTQNFNDARIMVATKFQELLKTYKPVPRVQIKKWPPKFKRNNFRKR
jgi:ATP phosphoribosyltransferase